MYITKSKVLYSTSHLKEANLHNDEVEYNGTFCHNHNYMAPRDNCICTKINGSQIAYTKFGNLR